MGSAQDGTMKVDNATNFERIPNVGFTIKVYGAKLVSFLNHMPIFGS